MNGVWGTVCDDYWGSIDARVVCKQLGFSRFGNNFRTLSSQCHAHYTYCIGTRTYYGASYGRGRGPIHLDDVRCTGSEQRLIDCSYNGGLDCSHAEDVSVYCVSRTS